MPGLLWKSIKWKTNKLTWPISSHCPSAAPYICACRNLMTEIVSSCSRAGFASQGSHRSWYQTELVTRKQTAPEKAKEECELTEPGKGSRLYQGTDNWKNWGTLPKKHHEHWDPESCKSVCAEQGSSHLLGNDLDSIQYHLTQKLHMNYMAPFYYQK
jgi:hypothetical protein